MWLLGLFQIAQTMIKNAMIKDFLQVFILQEIAPPNYSLKSQK